MRLGDSKPLSSCASVERYRIYCVTCLERVDQLRLTAEQRQELLQRDEVLDIGTSCFGSTPTLA